MKIKKLIEILNKIENQDLEIRLYDDELDDYIKFDGDCIEVHGHGCDFNFYKNDRQGTDIKHSGDIDSIKLVDYKNGENVYYYVCPFCKHQHRITSENYSYKFFEDKKEIQEQCEVCGKTLYID